MRLQNVQITKIEKIIFSLLDFWFALNFVLQFGRTYCLQHRGLVSDALAARAVQRWKRFCLTWRRQLSRPLLKRFFLIFWDRATSNSLWNFGNNMPMKKRGTKNPPILSHEFVIQNHADIVACVAMVFVVGLMFQVSSPLASLFIALHHNVR